MRTSYLVHIEAIPFLLAISCISVDYPALSTTENVETGSSSSSPTTTVSDGYCGDGTIDDKEECDDGPDNGPNKACLAGCVLNTCGDEDQGPGEMCDSGTHNGAGDKCTQACALNVCGDKILGPDATEDCDDGKNGNQDDGCTDLCKLPTCNDSFIQTSIGEECDLGPNNIDTGACTTGCKMAVCGDPYVWASKEECDLGAGNNADDKVCTAECKNNVCGDGHPGPGEECDDGNMNDSDECSNLCVNSRCGDGIKQANEECDDGNMNDSDGCSDKCIAARYIFVSSTPYNGNLGGLSGADKKCQGLADAQALTLGGRTWKAWLSSDAASPAGNAAFGDTFTGWYRLPSSTAVVKGWAGLLNATQVSFLSAINKDEAGNAATNQDVWTGTKSNGMKTSTNCMGWLSDTNAFTGSLGYSDKPDGGWTDLLIGNPLASSIAGCSVSKRIYCVEVPPL